MNLQLISLYSTYGDLTTYLIIYVSSTIFLYITITMVYMTLIRRSYKTFIIKFSIVPLSVLTISMVSVTFMSILLHHKIIHFAVTLPLSIINLLLLIYEYRLYKKNKHTKD